MTRYAEHQLVQRVGDDLVILDDQSGDEILVRGDTVTLLQSSIDRLLQDTGAVRVSIDVVLGNAAMQRWVDVAAAVERALWHFSGDALPDRGERTPVRDLNGNTVGEVVVR